MLTITDFWCRGSRVWAKMKGLEALLERTALWKLNIYIQDYVSCIPSSAHRHRSRADLPGSPWIQVPVAWYKPHSFSLDLQNHIKLPSVPSWQYDRTKYSKTSCSDGVYYQERGFQHPRRVSIRVLYMTALCLWQWQLAQADKIQQSNHKCQNHDLGRNNSAGRHSKHQSRQPMWVVMDTKLSVYPEVHSSNSLPCRQF